MSLEGDFGGQVLKKRKDRARAHRWVCAWPVGVRARKPSWLRSREPQGNEVAEAVGGGKMA